MNSTREPRRKFGVMLYPDQPFPVLAERLGWLEELGFDQVFLPDHSADLRDPRHTWFDSWTVLAMAALSTRRIRIGTLVANQILRPPAQLAKQAIALDHMSGGRFELGVGAGLFAWDHHSVGGVPWPPGERVRRFADYLAIVDGVLRGGVFSHPGTHLWARDVVTVPGSLQSPRLPLIVGGQSPTLVRVAAELADAWNTHGPPGATDKEVLRITTEQNARIDRLASAAGRDPSEIRRAYTIFGPWDPRAGRHGYEEIFERFGTAGVTEFVLDWPGERHAEEFARVAREVIPPLRGD
ncbi:LLM class flavin-dependent oxidoreductase [Streptomyces sp. A1-5]|uniref:LLM class flavin-dependent oxidoreductase n=1 Tax=Streptomyces sp. A1-5 TaxID=2738410 RepID=UPI001F404EE3|nr:LLM class flavin-dependent oxidoreductase [Streptomyces sp. A1-5]UJB44937.1 LLM class flavin-dependent oxidoreductase [Streptomyces sp. A1-5]